jgi:hypothetical protein
LRKTETTIKTKKLQKGVTMLLSSLRQLLYIHTEKTQQEKAYFDEDWLCSLRQVVLSFCKSVFLWVRNCKY